MFFLCYLWGRAQYNTNALKITYSYTLTDIPKNIKQSYKHFIILHTYNCHEDDELLGRAFFEILYMKKNENK